MKNRKALLFGLFVLLGLVVGVYITHIVFYLLGLENTPIISLVFFITTPVVLLAFFAYLIMFIMITSMSQELMFENQFSLGRKSNFYNSHALEVRVRHKRFWRYRNKPAYVVVFSPSNNQIIRSTSRNSVMSIMNGYLSDYLTEKITKSGYRIRNDNSVCYYHGYFVLYSFSDHEFIEKFTNDLAKDLFKIAEDHQIHVFLQPYFGITRVTNPKENLFTSIDNAISARNYAEKNFQEKIYYDEQIIKTVTDDDIKEIERAMENKEFLVYYQPKFSLKANEVVGSEALIRWNSPKYGFSGPDKFLPKAEEGGIMHDIDMYVFKAVCEDLSETKRRGRRLLPVSVNFSLYEFYAPNFLNDLVNTLKSYEIDPKYIEIEITESTSQANSFLAVSYLKKIKEQGLKILMDDFGTGYSNIANLNKLPIDKIKIDKSLIDNIVEDEKTRESVRYLINLCVANGMESIAEGVDNPKQVEILRRLHCDVIQGYYYSRPISKEAYDNFLLENKYEKKNAKKGGNN
ncbi:MAG: EAL domain-containing protein [Bacilli bacterium]|nr:EAL domain-containing protein [Bacilli bacterium]